MKQYKLSFLGFGNVGRALLRLLEAKRAELREQYGLEWCVTGVASRTLGWIASAEGLDPEALLTRNVSGGSAVGISEWLQQATPDVVFETIPLNFDTGQPAIEYLRASLMADANVVTANKGVVVHGYEDLDSLSRRVDRRFLFEATVLDSAPVFSLFRETLPAIKLRAFSGVFNSTTNVILETMEAGRTFEEGVKAAQDLGVSETDPAHDIDGWDATAKVCALATVLMKRSLKPTMVSREGIRSLAPKVVQSARKEGRPFKLVARARSLEDGSINASVKPEQLSNTDPLAGIRGTSLAIHFELDVMPGLTITSHRPNLQSTAYGLLSDFINTVRK